MSRRHVLVVLVVLFALGSSGIGESLASRHEGWQIVNLNGRFTVRPPVDDPDREEDRIGGEASFTFLATTSPDIIGENFPVSMASGDQYPASIAYNSNDNNYLAVWNDDRDQGSTGTDIYGQLVSPTDHLSGSAFPIARLPGDQLYAEVAYNSIDNEYLVIWYYDHNVHGQRISNTGALLGSELFVATSSHYRSSLAYNSQDNTYLVVSPVGDYTMDAGDLYGQLLSSAGAHQGNSFPICTADFTQGDPVVTYNSIDNGYIVVWTDLRNTDSFFRVVDVYGQLVSNIGQLIGGNLAISPIGGIDWEAEPYVVHNPDRNEYMVVWWDDRSYPEVDIYGRLMRGNGSFVGSSFSICHASRYQWTPCVAYSSIGEEYLVAWEDERDNSKDIYGQYVSGTGLLDGPNFPISTVRYWQEIPRIAYNSFDNEYLVVWPDERNKDTTGYDIYAQRVTSPDRKPPLPPSNLISTTHTIEQWSGEGQITVAWEPATDLQSGVDGYSIAWDESPDTVPDDNKDLEETATETTGPALGTGNSHYFHICTVDNAGNWSDPVHLGPFFIDVSRPSEPTDLASSTHIPDTWSSAWMVKVSWTPAQDGGSGLAGYSVIWDMSPDTLPDENMSLTADVTETESPELEDGNSHYFHIRSVDNVGNWSDGAAHPGPFLIDVSKPSEVTDLVSPTHTPDTWNSAPVVEVSWTPAVDETSGLQGYSVLWDTFAETLPDDIMELGSEVTEIGSEELADGDSHYFHIRAVDNAGNWCETATHIGPFQIDTTPPALVLGLSGPSHELETCSLDTVVQVTWAAATDESSGLQGYSVVWDTFAETLPDDVIELASDVIEHASAELPDGKDHYFHIRSIDNVNNASDEAAHIGPFYIDTTGPELATDLQSASHQLDVWSNNDTVDVGWTPAVDDCGMVDGYSLAWDSQPDTLPDDVKDIEGDATAATSPALTDGASYFHIRGVDNLGNWSDEAAHLGPFRIDVTKPSEVTDLASPTHIVNVCSPINVVEVSWTSATDESSGLQGYSVLWDIFAETLPDDVMDLGPDVTETGSAELPDADNHYFHIRSVDEVGNWCETATHIGPFYIDTAAPDLGMSVSSHEVDMWSNENVVTVDMSAEDKLCGQKGYSVVWDENPDTEPGEVQNTEALDAIDSPELTDGEWYLHAKPVDNAGNWGVVEHLGPFKIDTHSIHPPGNIASDTHVPQEWSQKKIVGVGWAPASDDLSGLKGYSIVWDNQPDTIPDLVPELVADVVYNLSLELPDGSDYWFHIRAIDNAGNGDRVELHIGPFYIEANPPEPVMALECTSHEMGEWSINNVLEFTWGPAVDTGSGLDGYAFVTDDSAFTVPDNRNLDSSATELSSESPDGKQYFHIRPVDKTGLWGETEHLGPFLIDVTPPPAPYITSTLDPEAWSDQTTASVSWQKITDETSGLVGYSLSWSASPDNEVDLGPEKTDVKEDLADGVHHLRIKTVDEAGNWSDVASLGPFNIDTTSPRSARIYRLTVDSGTDYILVKDNVVYYSAIDAGAFTVYVVGTDDGSGLKQALFSDSTSPGGVVEIESSDPNYSYSHQYQISADSGTDGQVDISLYDHAGNSATTSFNVSHDNVGPHKPVDVKCDDGAAWNTTGEVKVTWSGEGDDGSGVVNYYVEAGNKEPQENPDDGSMSVTIPVDDGESIEFYVRGLDNVGNWGIAGRATISVDTKAPGDVQEIVHTDSDANPGYDNDKELEFSWQSATDNIKVDHYEVHLSEDGGEYKLQESVEEENYTASGEDGKEYKLKVVAVDSAGNGGPATESEEIVCDMSEPEFLVAMLPNPGFHNFMDIVVISLEKLLEEPPVLKVKLAGVEKSVSLSEIIENMWVGSYTIVGNGTATLIVSGDDLAGNETDDDTNKFSVQTVLAGAPARIRSADGKLVLNIPAGAFGRDTKVAIIPVKLDEKLIRSLGAAQLAPGLTMEAGKLDELESVGQHYRISPDDARFLKTATLTLQYENTADVNEEHLGIYTWDSDASDWQYVDSLVDKRTSRVSAFVERFGTFGLYSDTKAPQVSHISPPDGTVLDTSLPEFAIGVTDNGSGVDLSSLSLLIDGQVVNVSKGYEDELIVLALDHGLTAGDHTFSIVGEDMAGNEFASVRRNIRIPEWAVIPDSSQLLQNYPNPFNPETWIPYRLSELSDVRLSIYSLSGQLIRTLELGIKKPGTYTDRGRAIYWDGRNENGETVSSGVYFYHLSAGEFTSIRKMTIVR